MNDHDERTAELGREVWARVFGTDRPPPEPLPEDAQQYDRARHGPRDADVVRAVLADPEVAAAVRAAMARAARDVLLRDVRWAVPDFPNSFEPSRDEDAVRPLAHRALEASDLYAVAQAVMADDMQTPWWWRDGGGA